METLEAFLSQRKVVPILRLAAPTQSSRLHGVVNSTEGLSQLGATFSKGISVRALSPVGDCSGLVIMDNIRFLFARRRAFSPLGRENRISGQQGIRIT